MMDQAAALRAAMRSVDTEPYGGGSRVPAIVVGSGKGGVGKSILAALLARSLARAGLRVLLVDGDEELANQHVLLHVSVPVPVGTVMDGEAPVTDLIVPVEDGLWLCPGGSGSETVHEAGPLDRGRFFNRIVDCFVDYDIVVIDAGAGIDSALRACQIGGTNLLVVSTPDPAAMTDAFAITKLVRHRVPGFPVEMVINRCLTDAEGRDASRRLQIACRRFLNFDCAVAGVLPEDRDLAIHVRRGTNLFKLDGAGEMSKGIDVLARQYQTRLGQLAEPAATS